MEAQVTDRKRRIADAHTRVRLRIASDDALVGAIRRGDPRAFEALYERHSGELQSFCVYMLGSRADAEDALQATFAAAYRSLRGEERPIALRAWLFAIARNHCLTILRRRHPTVELDGEPALHGDPARELELREEVRDTLVRLSELPERQRAAMVLAELRGFSQAEIGTVLGVRPEQVKALVYQARSDLISERRAREVDCHEIREEISSARGSALLRGRLRRHVRSCEDCRSFAAGVSRQRRQLNGLIPFAPWLMWKLRALQETLMSGITEPTAYAGGATLGGVGAGAALLAGGGVKAIAVKVMAGAAMLGLSTSVGAAVAPNQSITRLAGDVAHVSGAASSTRGGAGHAGAPGTLSASSPNARGATGATGATGLSGYTIGGRAGAVQRGASSERGPRDSASGHGSTRGGSKQGAGGGAGASARRSHTQAAGGGTGQSRKLAQEQHQTVHEGRQQQHEGRQQQRSESQAVREERKLAAEERRTSAPERVRAAEERQRAQGQRHREREKSAHQEERQRNSAQHQHEREKAKHERTHELAGAQHAHQREKAQRQRELQRERKRRERERAGRRGRKIRAGVEETSSE